MFEVLLATVLLVGEATEPSADPSMMLEICDSGGWRAEQCSLTCHRVFNYWTTTCNVSCRSGYYACCSCDSGCQCVMDHDELWPLPPTPKPEPQPDPDDED
jgi:hypothetical protein